MEEGECEEGLTWNCDLITQEECTYLGADWSELDCNVYKLLPFVEDKVCAERSDTCWPFRRSLVASPII